MKRLLAIEWNKLFYYKSTRIFTLLYFVLLIVIGVILAFIKPTIGGVKLDIVQLGFFKFPTIWQNITYLVAIGKIFLAIIIVLNITNEFSNGTLKQNLIDGMSKKEFLYSKLLTSFVLVAISTLFVFFITLILGLVFAKGESVSFQGIEFMSAYFLKLVFFFVFCAFLSLLLKKSALALLGIVVWWIGEAVIKTIEAVATMNIGKEGDTNSFLLSNYLPLSSSSNLIDFPKIKIEGFITGQSIFVYQSVNWSFFVVTLLYTALFIWLAYWLLKKRDL
ncbi:MAG: ABC transporter permease [Crocinitomicaceae bacterium]|nr:ABC transporter permease [Crocinitomicaceae bacterium]